MRTPLNLLKSNFSLWSNLLGCSENYGKTNLNHLNSLIDEFNISMGELS